MLLIDPLDPGSGAAIEKNAESKGVKVIDYDRLVTGGPADRYYVSFDNVKVGQLIGQGEVDCITAWNVKKPQHPDHGRRPHRQQREAVRPGIQRGARSRSSTTARTSRSASRPARGIRPRAQTTFEQQYTAHPNINAVVTPNDDNANAVISALQDEEDPAEDVPDHRSGRVACRVCRTSSKGYQCGTVYKPIYLEAQAAAALALYLRAGQTPPASLVNATTKDTTLGADIKSVYTDADLGDHGEHGRRPSSRTAPSRSPTCCSGGLASACSAAGIQLTDRLPGHRLAAAAAVHRRGTRGGTER